MEEGKIHVGSMIRHELRAQGRSVAWLSRTICLERCTIYKIFERENIDVKLLARLCVLLNHDFFADISTQIFEGSSKMSTKTVPNCQQEFF
jgi:hypothetical protein